MTPLAAYILLFLAVGVGFIFVHLVAGKLLRPSKKNPEKDTIYECGEPTIGSAWIQFDLRFYVVALLFVIFDVEVAFFFPWAEVFGKANAIRNAGTPTKPEEYNAFATKVLDLAVPMGARNSDGDRQFWERVKFLTEGAKGAKALEEPASILNQVVEKIKQEQDAEAKRLEGVLAKMPDAVQKQMMRALVSQGPEGPGPLSKLPPPQVLRRRLDDQATQVMDLLKGTPFGKLRQIPTEDVELIAYPVAAQVTEGGMRKELEAARAVSRRHVQEVREAAAAVINAGDPEERGLIEGVSLEQMANLGATRVNDSKRAAENLAWLAFFEILFFFGVLLVGFAYLWRRGDLAWVRSMEAEAKGS